MVQCKETASRSGLGGLDVDVIKEEEDEEEEEVQVVQEGLLPYAWVELGP
jgi:hypothetical protein